MEAFWKAVWAAMHDPAGWPIVVSILAAKVRWIMGYDTTFKEVVQTLIAAMIMSLWVAPGVAEYFELGARAAASVSVLLGIVARPALDGVMRLGKKFREDPTFWRGK